MRFDIHHRYDAGVTRVHAMLADPAFWQQSLQGGRVQAREVTATDGGVNMIVDVKTPSQLARLVGPTMTLGMTTTWAQDGDGWRGPMTADTGKLPGSFTGTSTISPDGDGCAVVYTGEFSVNVPLIGGSLEKRAVPYLTGMLDDQQASGDAWLAAHPAA